MKHSPFLLFALLTAAVIRAANAEVPSFLNDYSQKTIEDMNQYVRDLDPELSGFDFRAVRNHGPFFVEMVSEVMAGHAQLQEIQRGVRERPALSKNLGTVLKTTQDALIQNQKNIVAMAKLKE